MKTEKVRSSIKSLKNYKSENKLMDDEPITRGQMCAICRFSEDTLTDLKRKGILRTNDGLHYKKRYRLRDVIEQLESMLVGPSLPKLEPVMVGKPLDRTPAQDSVLMTVRYDVIEEIKSIFARAAARANRLGDTELEKHILHDFWLKEEEIRKIIMM